MKYAVVRSTVEITYGLDDHEERDVPEAVIAPFKTENEAEAWIRSNSDRYYLYRVVPFEKP